MLDTNISIECIFIFTAYLHTFRLIKKNKSCFYLVTQLVKDFFLFIYLFINNINPRTTITL